MPTQLLDTTLTLRLACSERTRLDREAHMLHISTAAYVRFLIAPKKTQQKLSAVFERQQLRREYADILRILGQSRIANNLNQIAHAIHTGTLVVTPDVVVQINEAYESILYIRSLLIEHMGVKVR